MENDIYNAFHDIKAEDNLKKHTYFFLQDKIKQRRQNTLKRFTMSFAYIALVFLVGLSSYHIYFTETGIVDIDVNPSIELSLNRFNRIIDSNAYNEDGHKVLENVTIKNKSYRNAIEILINQMIEMDYIKNSGLFTTTLQLKNKQEEQELLNELQSYIDIALQSQNKSMEQDAFIVDPDTKSYSHEHNLSPAKYLAILELQAVDPIADFDSCREHSISEIKQQTHQHRNGGSKHVNKSHGHRGNHE